MTAETQALTEELRDVSGKLDDVLHELSEVRAQQETEGRRAVWHRIVSASLAVVMLLLGWLFVRDAQERDRAEFRQCVVANNTRADIRAGILETVLVIAAPLDPETEELLDRIQVRLTETIPDREC